MKRIRSLEGIFRPGQERFYVPFVYKGKGHFRSILPKQSILEINSLYEMVMKLGPKNVLEIGTGSGGTLYLWVQAAQRGARIVSIDLPGGEFGGGYRPCRIPFYRSFGRKGQQVHLLLEDSHREETLKKVERLFEGEGIDFLFIYGDHSYNGVKKDFLDYGRLVNSGGLVAIHDILPREDDPKNKVSEFWGELKGQNPFAQEIVSPVDFGRKIGIGLLRVP